MNSNLLHTLAQNIKPFHAQRYLVAKGWREIKGIPRKDIFLFKHSGTDQRIMIPCEDHYELYAADILSSAQQLQGIEKRDLVSILTQLANPDIDILRYRIQSQHVEIGTLSLSVVNKFISGVVDSLRASLCDIQNSHQAHHTKMSNKFITQTLEHVQFGQTEYGSFVVKIMAPIDIADEDNTFEVMRNITIRQGIVHLLQSANQMICVIQENNTQSFIEAIKERPPFSDNLVNALLDMQLWEDATIELSSEWAPILPEERTPAKITIPAEYFKDIEKISRSIAPPIEKQAIEIFTGFVMDLEGETNERGKKQGLVRVKVSTYDKESFTAFINLPEYEHDLAISAYRENLPITFSGKLIRCKNCYEILNIKLFRLQDSDEQQYENLSNKVLSRMLPQPILRTDIGEDQEVSNVSRKGRRVRALADSKSD
jgi:hypothetical protein